MKLALAGTSHWHAGMHLEAAGWCGAGVAGVWDEDPAQAADFASRHGLAAFGGFDDLLGSRPDAVLLMGHPATVPVRARRVIEAGVPLILEKPAAHRTELLADLLSLARARNAFVSIPLPNRFGPAVLRFRALQSEGRAGAVAHGHFRIVNGPPDRYAADGVPWMIDPEVSGGGALRNLGIHGVDAALDLATGGLSLVSASIGNRIHAGSAVEDYALLVLEDATGAIFTVEAGYTFASLRPGGDFEWRIVSANSTLIDRGETVTCATLDDAVRVALPPEPTATRYRLCMRDTLQRLAGGRPPGIGLGDYVAAMTLIDMAYSKAER